MMFSPAPIRRILVVVKVHPRADRPASKSPLARRDRRRIRQARLAHEAALRRVLERLRKSAVPFRVIRRVRRRVLHGFDLIISVGGDGTFLEAARGVRNQPILGVNSNPTRSAGSFCAATSFSFDRVLGQILRGGARVVRLNRLQPVLNRRPMDLPILNDVLITHRRPAAMSRYGLQIGRRLEEQRSSGLWIATAAGSTGAIRSAGAAILPRTSRDLLYQPRELYAADRNGNRLTGGRIPADAPIQISCLMREGLLCVDGEHVTLPFRYGDLLELRVFAHPLRLVAG